MKLLFSLIFIFFCFLVSCEQNERIILGIDYAKQELQKCKIDKTTKHILVDTLIKTETTAIKFAETLLFDIYGEKNIIKQKPYEVYYLENYWVVKGTIPKNTLGGTFLIIFNSSNGQVIKLTHEK